MSSNKKKLKMERLSPIPASHRDHLQSEALRTPKSSMSTSHKRRRDTYAIESTSSPEFGKLPVPSSKRQRSRNASVKNSTNMPTPLSGLISRKPVTSDPSDNLCGRPMADTLEVLPVIDDSSPRKPPYSPRHAEIISASAVFPLKSLPSSSTTPLGGIINKKTTTVNRSLNDSILILQEAEDLSDDDDIADAHLANPRKSDDDEVNIESFESPQKDPVLSKERANTSGVFKKFHQSSRRHPGSVKKSLIIEKPGNSSVEMSGNEKKNRKRALDFNSSTFVTPIATGDECLYLTRSLEPLQLSRNLGSNALELESSTLLEDSVGRSSPVLNLKPSCRRADDRTLSVIEPMCSALPEDSEGRSSPILNLKPWCRGADNRTLTVTEPMSSTLSVDGEGRPSAVLNLKPSCPGPYDRRLTVMEPASTSLLEDYGGRLSPVLNLKPSCSGPDHRTLSVSSSLLEDCEGRLSPVLNLKPSCPGPDHRTLSVVEPVSSTLLANCEGRLSPVLSLMPLPPGTHDGSIVLETNSSSLLEDLGPQPPLLNQKQPYSNPTIREPSMLLDDCRGRLSPVLTENSLCPPVASMSSFLEGADRLSPVLNVKSLYRTEDDVLIPTSPSNISKHGRQSPILEVTPTRGQTSVDHDHQSDADSVIEDTPRQSQNRKCDLGGFIASSSFRIESFSPSRANFKIDDADSDSEILKIEDFPDEGTADKGKCDLNLVVVSHDTSDESMDAVGQAAKDCDIIVPTIDEQHSPNIQFNYTARAIRSFESPSKPFNKPFSEAIDIGAFGSPDSNASFGHQTEDVPSDVIEGSTTQEYVEESEQVRPTKRRKKGSLLERVKSVIAKGNASNTLFEYEMKCGLRPKKGKLVSTPLVVLNKPGETPTFLVCKPLKHCSLSHIDRISSFVIVHANKLPPGTHAGSAVLLHFPLSILYHSELHLPYVLAGTQIVSHPEPDIDIDKIDTSQLKSMEELSYFYSAPITAFRTFPSTATRTLSQAALCQNLTEESNLYLTVLHLTRFYESGDVRKISVLCCDEESQCCWLTFSSMEDINRVAALETLGVLSDGSNVQTKGFSVVSRIRMDKKTKHLANYCSNVAVGGGTIFSVFPDEPNWVISAEGRGKSSKTPSTIADILRNTLGSRHLLEVHEVDRKPEIILKDPQGQSIRFVNGENASITLDHSVPFFLDAVYFYDGQLFSDEHTRVVLTGET